MKNRLILLIIAILVSLQIGAQTNFQTKVDSILIDSDFSGTILISKNNSTVYSAAKGYANLEGKIPMNLDDQFVIGSISKQITAVLILREYEKKTLDLNDKVGTYLKHIKQSWAKAVTIHQLLTHTHGIVAIGSPLEFEPGAKFKYSQLGYELLANILSKITNQTFEANAMALFKEFGLTNTYHPDNKNYKNLVNGYVEDNNGQLTFESGSLENYVAAGSFISNASDLIRWNELLNSDRLVKPKTLKSMQTKYATRDHPIFDKVNYGYGLLFKEGEAHVQIGALGYAPGFVSASYYYPDTNFNLVILENTVYDLNNFQNTFKVHTAIMDLVKEQQL